MNKETTNRIREEWEKEMKNEDSNTSSGCYECGREINADGVADWWLSKIAELLKSQAEQLEGIYGFSPDDWEKKKQELLKSQKESRKRDLQKLIDIDCACDANDCDRCKLLQSLIKQSN